MFRVYSSQPTSSACPKLFLENTYTHYTMHIQSEVVNDVSGDMARSPKSRVGKGLKGQAKRAVRDRLNAIAASERNVEHKLAVAKNSSSRKTLWPR
jgi:hypothetical protein